MITLCSRHPEFPPYRSLNMPCSFMCLDLRTYALLCLKCHILLSLQASLYQETPLRNFGRLLWSLQSELCGLFLPLGRGLITLSFPKVLCTNSVTTFSSTTPKQLVMAREKSHDRKSQGFFEFINQQCQWGLSIA